MLHHMLPGRIHIDEAEGMEALQEAIPLYGALQFDTRPF